MKDKFLIILFILVLLFFQNATGQTKVRGMVKDAETGEPLPFVNVSFKGTTVGVITDFNGKYFLETKKPVDSVVFSYVGYQRESFSIQSNTFQIINTSLQPSSVQLQEVVVVPGENPAHVLLRKIDKNRKRNNIERYDTYSYEVYNKMEIDISNVDENFRKNRLFKQFQFVFDYVDTSAVTGKSYLPVFITETLSDFYFQKSPKKEKEVIHGSNISGVKNEKISEFTGQMYLKVNIYENFMSIFGKGFVSPIASFGKLYYKYYLVDSSYIDNSWCYQVSFQPKRKQDPTFTGDFWVHDTTYAIKKVNIRIAEDANINFVNDLYAEMDYQKVQDSLWFLKREHYFIDFNIADKTSGIFGRKTTSYRDVKLNIDIPEGFFNPQVAQETITKDSVNEKTTDFWQGKRHEILTEKESNIYQMVDSIKQVPVFRTWVDVINTLITGHYVVGFWEIGPYYKLYSFNAIEGHRFRFGGRTSNDFSTKVMFTGHVAYGEKDDRFKGALGMIYMLNKNPRRSAGFNIKHDMEQLGISQNAFTQDNILASFLRRTYNKKLTMVNEAGVFYEHEWYQGFSNTLSINTRRIFGTEYVPFQTVNNADTATLSQVSSTEIKLNTRFAYNEKFLMGEFERVSLGTKYPILNLNFIIGLPNVLKSTHEYYKLHMSIDHKFNINPFGRFRYIVDAGYYFGTAPYPLLQIHEGNETYAYDDYAFNMMNYYEFVSDRYISVLAEHHFDGFFLNRIPLFRKLKWREVIAAKALIGRVSERNRDAMIFPDNLRGLKEPYIEASAGIENILKLFRIDAMWRLTYLDKPDDVENFTKIPKFGIRAQLKVEF
ncbi:TonB-linked outer membrane protein, SusC/RagA family [Salinivirga cyanobacteriivorans]|uniref:TonB-linked outer membrane protein, SusC/RagA family n=1 Tax=Salinivirga cyanobacteriivorans TaxID=1307839 RepID=A0A0S2HYI8_9BACT|nr:DUF5686 and carboxypeptidase-like regulatory domain-containing protein [Salinivirga cyanobacteriivorans]ALO15120.1 TonB-linked outer membrane protein, SusC/RagA family [Salinivirga cyanobacteriivorans]